MLSVVLNVLCCKSMLSVIMLNVIRLNVVVLNVVILSVLVPIIVPINKLRRTGGL